MKHHIQSPLFFMGLAVYGGLIFTLQLFFNQSGSRSADLLVGLWNIMAVINPLLPAALLVGETIVCDRLQAKGIYSLAPSLVVLAGRLRVFCFDKTGTLTKEGLQLISCHEVEPGGIEFRSIVNMSKGNRYSLIDAMQGDDSSSLGADTKIILEPSPMLQLGIASCHTVTITGGQYVGNPVEVEMLKRSGWELVPLGGQENQPKKITG
jgi:cation-transporting ATPase 13A3/4/5